MSRAATAAVATVGAVGDAIEGELLSRETGRKVTLQVIEKVSGVAVDPDDEKARIDAEGEERERLAQERANALALEKTTGQLGGGDPPEGGQSAPPKEPRPKEAEEDDVLIKFEPHITINRPQPQEPPVVHVTVPPPSVVVREAEIAAPAQPAPVVNVTVEPTPVTVQVPQAAPPDVHVHVPEQEASETVVERDEKTGRIERTVRRPLKKKGN